MNFARRYQGIINGVRGKEIVIEGQIPELISIKSQIIMRPVS